MNSISNKTDILLMRSALLSKPVSVTGLPKRLSLILWGKTSLPLVRKSNSIVSILINVNCLWNVLLMSNANMVVVTPLPALILSLFHVLAAIVLQVPVTVVPDFLPAASTSLFVNLISLTRSIALSSSITALVSMPQLMKSNILVKSCFLCLNRDSLSIRSLLLTPKYHIPKKYFILILKTISSKLSVLTLLFLIFAEK